MAIAPMVVRMVHAPVSVSAAGYRGKGSSRLRRSLE
jgi:hypothetical protein